MSLTPGAREGGHNSQVRPNPPTEGNRTGRALLSRVGSALAQVFVPKADWLGPQLPIAPQAPDNVAGRQWDFPPGYNIQIQPRQTEEFSFNQLRMLAQYDIIAGLVSRRVDQIRDLDWQIRPRSVIGSETPTSGNDERIREVQDFLQEPGPGVLWEDFIGALVTDILEIDSPCVYIRRTKGGDLYSLDIIDGSLITPKIGSDGRAPLPPLPAYQQVLHGLPAVDYTRDEMIYRPRNPRSYKMYGRSPVEMIALTINMCLRRSVSQLSFFTEGTIPDGFITGPEGWTQSQLEVLQQWFDATLSGNLAKRRKLTVVPFGAKFQEWKQPILKDEFDEWLTRIACFSFAYPPTVFTKSNNRACYSADTETLTERGWRKFEEVEPGERIATVNPDTLGMEFHEPTALYVYPYEGDMVRINTKTTDVLVTPDHDMWVSPSGKREYRKRKAEELIGKQVELQASVPSCEGGTEQTTFTLPYAGPLLVGAGSGGITVQMDDWLELLGYYISEGGLSHRHRHIDSYLFTLAQNHGRVCDNIQSVLDRLPFKSTRYPPNESDPCQRWNVFGRDLWTWLFENVGGRCGDKRIPRQFMAMNRRQSRILFDALMDGDGSWDKRDNRVSGQYYTTSKALADDVQELAFRLGYNAAVRDHYDAHGNRARAYRVSIVERDVYRTIETAVTKEPYDGVVYCFSVPNHLFVTRRNGKIGIHGNTADVSQEVGIDEGREPLKKWLKGFLDLIIRKAFGYRDLEFVWIDKRTVKPEDQAKIDASDVNAGIRTRQEVRILRGLDPVEGADVLTVTTGQGIFPVTHVEALSNAQISAGEPGAVNVADLSRTGDGKGGPIPVSTAGPKGTPLGGATTKAALLGPGENRTLRSLYLMRPLLNAEEVETWARASGFTSVVTDPHVTILRSVAPVDWGTALRASKPLVVRGGTRSVQRFGNRAVVLEFTSGSLQSRFEELTTVAGGAHAFPEYRPHVTITLEAPADLNESAITPFQGDLIFGVEEYREVTDGADDPADKALSG